MSQAAMITYGCSQSADPAQSQRAQKYTPSRQWIKDQANRRGYMYEDEPGQNDYILTRGAPPGPFRSLRGKFGFSEQCGFGQSKIPSCVSQEISTPPHIGLRWMMRPEGDVSSILGFCITAAVHLTSISDFDSYGRLPVLREGSNSELKRRGGDSGCGICAPFHYQHRCGRRQIDSIFQSQWIQAGDSAERKVLRGYSVASRESARFWPTFGLSRTI